MTRALPTTLLAFLCALIIGAPAALAATDQRGPLILAAASMQDALTAASDAWTAAGHRRPVLSFAGSSALARQVKAGAPADIFISADEDWMDDVERAGAIAPRTRADIAGNRLALIAPLDRPVRLKIAPAMPIARALGASRLAMADPDSVPAGKYGKAALERLGVWTSVEARVARAQDVRGALMFVERGETALGIVYATDARASRKVRIVGLFPQGSHPPIRYPIARLRAGTNGEAEGFRQFLLSRYGQAILARYGFTRP